MPLPDIVRALYVCAHAGEAPSQEFVDAFLKEKIAFHGEREAVAGPPPAIECVVARARAYKSRGVKIAIASSGLRSAVER